PQRQSASPMRLSQQRWRRPPQRPEALQPTRWQARDGPSLRRSRPTELRGGLSRGVLEDGKRRSVHLPGIGPGGTPGHKVDLSKNVAHDLIGLVLFTQLV